MSLLARILDHLHGKKQHLKKYSFVLTITKSVKIFIKTSDRTNNRIESEPAKRVFIGL